MARKFCLLTRWTYRRTARPAIKGIKNTCNWLKYILMYKYDRYFVWVSKFLMWLLDSKKNCHSLQSDMLYKLQWVWYHSGTTWLHYKHYLLTVSMMWNAISHKIHWMHWSLLQCGYITWPYYAHYLAIRMKCCRICDEKPSTLGIMITRTGPLSTSMICLLFDFFRGDSLGLFRLLHFICSLYHADKVMKLHWFFFTLSFTVSSKSSSWQKSTKILNITNVTLWHISRK